MKRFLSVILASVMIFGCLALGISAESYHEPDDGPPIFADVDVKDGKWYTDYVYTVFHKGIMEGTSPKDTWGTEHSTFEPNATLTRAMLAAIIVRFADKVYGTKLTLPEDYNRSFTDVKEGQWYTDYAYVAKANGIVGGYADGSFRPNKAVTREEAVLMISRMIFNSKITGNSAVYLLNDAPEEPFKDEDKITVGNNAKAYTDALARMGVLNGDTKGYFNPKANITRAETAKIIAKLFEVRVLDESNMSEYAELYSDESEVTWKAGTTQYLDVGVKFSTAFCYYGGYSNFSPTGWVKCKAMMYYITLPMEGFLVVEKGSSQGSTMTYEIQEDAEEGVYDLTIKIPFVSKVIEDCVTIVK